MTSVTDRQPAGTTELIRHLSVPRGFGDASLIKPRTDIIELLGGIPHTDVLPLAAYREAIDRIWSDRSHAAAGFQYSNSAGIAPLREWIAAREGVSPDRILITNGGFHGLALAVQALVERNAAVAVDDPVFPLFLKSLELSNATPRPVPVDEDGIDTEVLERLLATGERFAAVYTVPDFHNPSQGSLSNERRRHLLDLAEHHGFTVFADNPYRELGFGTRELDAQIFNHSAHALHINTFTKTLGPGLRLGWIVLPEALVPSFVQLRNRQDSHSSTLQQVVVAELVTHDDAWFDDLLVSARALYARQSRALVDALESALPGFLNVTRPDGGFFVWPRFSDPDVDAERLHALALEEGVSYQQGSYFASGLDSEAGRHLRIAYSNADPEELGEAARRLAAAASRL